MKKKQKRKLLVVMHSTKKQAKTLKNALKVCMQYMDILNYNICECE